MGYHQYYGGTNDYSYRNLLWRMDKICHYDKTHLQTKHLNKDQEKSFLKLWNFNNAESLFYIISDIETVVYESVHFQYKNLSDRYSNNM